MDLNLKGKCAIITGGSQGIGLACAKRFCSEGVNVVIAAHADIDKAILEIKSHEQDGAQAIGVMVDLKKKETPEEIVQTALDHFHRLDILVNCAGAARAGSFLELSDEDFIEAWTLKSLGYIRMVRAAMPYMIEQKDGRIINLIGSAGRTPPPTFLPGSTANAALINFTRGISRELAENNIRINAISPAPTQTERAKQLAQQTAEAKGVSIDEIWAETTSGIPLGRMIKPEEIANLAAFLVSDLSASITGAEILIDGGKTPCI